MRAPMGVVLVALCLWLAIALVVDHYLIATVCPNCTRIAAVALTLQIPAGSLNLPRVGLALVAGLPLLALALYLVPWRSLGDSAQWGQAFRLWCQPIIWLAVALALAVVGESLYLVSKDHWSQGMRNVAEAFSISATFTVDDFQFLTLKGGVTALLGLIVGIYLFIRKGVGGVFRRSAA
jgi:hypothetical protein